MLQGRSTKSVLFIAVTFLLVWVHAAYATVSLRPFSYTLQQQDLNLHQIGEVLADNGQGFPKTSAEISTWLEKKQSQSSTSFFGGSYWLAIEIINRSSQQELILFPYNTLLSRIETHVYNLDDENESIATYLTGGSEVNEFPFHYGNKIQLKPGQRYVLITRFQSDYFYTPPKLVLKPYDVFYSAITLENMIMLLCFGVGIALGLYNALIYLASRDVTYLFYALFTASWVFAWSHFFHIPDQLFNQYNSALHWFGFCLIPLFNILFYSHFLKLKQTAPKLYLASMYLAVVATLGVPFTIYWPGFGFLWATLTTGATLCLGLFIGLRSWLSGFKPARFFVLAYISMAIPNMIGNLTNLGLLPPITTNLYLIGLIGTAMDAMLLAFAMADKFRLVNEENVELNKNLEQKVQDRTTELEALTVELRDANEAKSRFLANISHEIRTPMTSIIGYADGIMLGDIKPHERNHGISVILQNSRHVLNLINDILDMSKIEANKLEISIVETDLFKVIYDVESLIAKQMRDKGLTFKLDYQFPLPDLILTDAHRLQQILLNLTTNALKFTTLGSVHLVVSYERNELCFKVKDTGIGMTETEQNALFNPFYQADSSISRQYGGTGLGLNISKNLALKLNGDIYVRSKIGAGSEFTLKIPVEKSENTRWLADINEVKVTGKPSLKSAVTKVNLKGRVLLAEDHPDNRRLISRILERMGLDVCAVENGKEAVQATLDTQFDLVLLDIQMPVMDGEEALKIMTATGITTPVVALTANTMNHEVSRYLKQGFTDHIAKPIDRNSFSQKIASYLQRDDLADIHLPEKEFMQLKQEYISGLVAQQDEMKAQLKIMDIDGLSKNVHILKGAASMFECDELSHIACRVDEALKKDIVTIDKRLLESLFSAMDKEIKTPMGNSEQ